MSSNVKDLNTNNRAYYFFNDINITRSPSRLKYLRSETRICLRKKQEKKESTFLKNCFIRNILL